MEKSVRSEKFLRKRKMLLVMPLLVLPFITIGFYALGGGSGDPEQGKQVQGGLNIELPSAEVKEDANANKLSFYEKAAELQKQREKEIQNDPYFRLMDTDDDTLEEDNPEGKIYEKISLLQKEINKPAPSQPGLYTNGTRPVYSKQFEGNVDRLEQMMSLMNEKNEDDPEMRQLDTMLEKIMDVQNPGRVRERLKEKVERRKENVLEVSKAANELCPANRGGFFGLIPDGEDSVHVAGAIEAMVHESQTLVNGSVIKLRLVSDVSLKGIMIPKDNFIYGTAFLNGERLKIEISSIRFHNVLYPVKMEVYDLDGLAGIYVPGTITRDVAKQSADNSLQLIDMSTMDPSLKAQVTAAGIDAAKNLLSRKVKLVRVSVKAGYKVLLANSNLNF